MERNDVAAFDMKNMKAIQQVLKDEEKRNKEINKMIDEDRQLKRKEVILLLLGMWPFLVNAATKIKIRYGRIWQINCRQTIANYQSKDMDRRRKAGI